MSFVKSVNTTYMSEAGKHVVQDTRQVVPRLRLISFLEVLDEIFASTSPPAITRRAYADKGS